MDCNPWVARRGAARRSRDSGHDDDGGGSGDDDDVVVVRPVHWLEIRPATHCAVLGNGPMGKGPMRDVTVVAKL